jgi:cytidylate kinase
MRALSIGTGLGDVVTIDNRRLSIINGLKEMATTSKKVAARLGGQYGESGQYYRFNVDQGLQDITLSDWEKASKISSHTHNYLIENQRMIKKCADDFASIAQAEERYDGETSLTMCSEAVDEDRSRPQDMPSTASRVETQMAAVAVAAAGELGGAPSS